LEGADRSLRGADRDSVSGDALRRATTAPVSPYVVVDQFGYRPNSEKIAVVRSPMVGFDAANKFTPGQRYAVVRIDSDASEREVFSGELVPWHGGVIDPSSGDIARWFDFSSVSQPGDYRVVDVSNNARSDVFRIADDVYRDALTQAVRMLYYQRDGVAKEARFAGRPWADGPAHMGPGQATECRAYSGGPARDVHGGWYDAGDQNKYTNAGASDVIELLRAYSESPNAFLDDTGIPESGNTVPDVVDEAIWELAWLERMQAEDGSVLSVIAQEGARSPESGGSPDTSPSKATSPCTYGPATTSASLTTAAAFAFSSRVLGAVPQVARVYPGFAAELARRAENAWSWAMANPNATFWSGGKMAGGEQELNDEGRTDKALGAAVFLFELTRKDAYREYFDSHSAGTPLRTNTYVDLYAVERQEFLLEYTRSEGADTSIARAIAQRYREGVESDANLGAHRRNADPYLAYVHTYTWGSNACKARQGAVFTDIATFGIDPGKNAEASRYAERYIHYLHGVNPLGLVYLSNMADFGASRSVTRFFHTWFAHGSNWDSVGTSKYGPPPGFLVGGPNPSYAWDSCCPGRCRWRSCGPAPLSPPAGQPPQKSYRDFNDAWPLNSWSVTEPDDAYQTAYIRLLSKFVAASR